MNSNFPRVTLPNTTPLDDELRERIVAAAAAETASSEHVQAQKVGMVSAMMRLGYRPYLGTAKRRRRKMTRHVRLMRALAARSSR